MLFFNTSKIQFESKSQPFLIRFKNLLSCFSIRQRYNLKANHNGLSSVSVRRQVVFQYVKDTIWKQITTKWGTNYIHILLFFNTSKIQFESKSQQHYRDAEQFASCFSIRQRYNLKANHNSYFFVVHNVLVVFQYVKDTIWKQITTIRLIRCRRARLFFNTSKIQFESKSQLAILRASLSLGCFSIRQRYNLKANHN